MVPVLIPLGKVYCKVPYNLGCHSKPYPILGFPRCSSICGLKEIIGVH